MSKWHQSPEPKDVVSPLGSAGKIQEGGAANIAWRRGRAWHLLEIEGRPVRMENSDGGLVGWGQEGGLVGHCREDGFTPKAEGRTVGFEAVRPQAGVWRMDCHGG